MSSTNWNFGLISTSEFGDLETEYLTKVMKKKRVYRYTPGPVDASEAFKLEQLYANLLGVNHCLAVSSGTSALVTALIAAKIGPGDEVIVPAYTSIATPSAVALAGAVPVIAEIDDTLTLDPKKFEAAITPHTKAVITVHMRGVPCQMDEILRIARKYDLLVIEDVAQANGGSYRGQPLGSIGDVGCFSFGQHKIVTAGEGGLVATDNQEIHLRASAYHDHTFVDWGPNREHTYEKFASQNYRLSEVHAAIALAQSQRLQSLVSRFQNIKKDIVERIRDIEGITLQRIPDPAGDTSYSLVFFMPDSDLATRFTELLGQEGIPCLTMRDHYPSGLPDRHVYTNWHFILNKLGTSAATPWNSENYDGNVSYSARMCPVTLDLLNRGVSIPLHQDMTVGHCNDLVRAVRKVAAKLAGR